MAKLKAPKMALIIPILNLNPRTNQAAIPKAMILNTQLNIPKVIKLTGEVTNRTTELTTPKTAAEIKALGKLSISTPKGSLDTKNKATAVTNQIISKEIISPIEINSPNLI